MEGVTGIKQTQMFPLSKQLSLGNPVEESFVLRVKWQAGEGISIFE